MFDHFGTYDCWGRTPGAADGTSCGTDKVDAFFTLYVAVTIMMVMTMMVMMMITMMMILIMMMVKSYYSCSITVVHPWRVCRESRFGHGCRLVAS